MKLFNKVLDKGAELTQSIGDAFDKNFTSKEERLELRNELVNKTNNLLLDLHSLQANLITAEATGSKLQRNWRPITMLSLLGIVIVSTFFSVHLNDVPSDFWSLLKLGMGGYIGGRSVEKITESVSTAINKK